MEKLVLMVGISGAVRYILMWLYCELLGCCRRVACRGPKGVCWLGYAVFCSKNLIKTKGRRGVGASKKKIENRNKDVDRRSVGVSLVGDRLVFRSRSLIKTKGRRGVAALKRIEEKSNGVVDLEK